MRLALDAMGGDSAPQVVLEGAIEAARADQLPITLLGPEDVLEPL
ncbi:MAG TPA: phosphate--acyl-ACP acyltransferase, partial [Dehalococcoidia bacterium]|nr:phosphate--acyl-ACP acyltransferase [Dehalococcoidia bacterium]